VVLDVKGAFLKTDIDESSEEKLYLRLPNGQLMRLHKYIYRLKQTRRKWQGNVTSTLVASVIEPLWIRSCLLKL